MELKEIGYFSKTHGIKGHLILKNDKDFFFEEANALFLEVSGGKAPYFISNIKESNNGLIVLLEDVNAIEKAKLLIGKKIFIDEKFLCEEEEKDNWVGYELIDISFGSLGNITEVNDSGYQVLISVIYKGKEVILPLVDDFIQSIDNDAKKISFKAPEGLIDLYITEKN